jgi:phospholipid-binding lipoprotein MlaA
MAKRQDLWKSAFLVAGIVTAGSGAARADDAAAPTAPEAPAASEEAKTEDSDSGLMRFMFEFNKGVDTLLIRPVATLYQGLTPPEAQEGIHNMVNNIRAPIVAGNDLLQGETERAGITMERAFINTTQGFLGWNDKAAEMGIQGHDEDFGQTLGAWGVDEGDYVVLPIIGPSTSRDALGSVVDFLTMPPGVGAVAAMDKRTRMEEDLKSIEKTSVDHYAAIKSLYLQNRRYEVANQKTEDIQQAGEDFPTLSMDDIENK